MRLIFLLLTLLSFPTATWAQVVPYTLDPSRSTVVFTFTMAGTPTKGQMQIDRADIRLNLGAIEQSSAAVTMNAASARTQAAFANEAMQGASVLNTAQFPTMSYRSASFQGDLNGGTVEGLLTLRGVTKPVQMRAQIFRQRGSAANDVSRLSVLLTGQIDRRDFGADGFPQIVGPTITFEVLTRIDRSG